MTNKKNAYGQCLLCQLVRGGMAYARHDYEQDSCDEHRDAKKKHSHPFADIDDIIDLDKEQEDIYSEIWERHKIEFPA